VVKSFFISAFESEAREQSVQQMYTV